MTFQLAGTVPAEGVRYDEEAMPWRAWSPDEVAARLAGVRGRSGRAPRWAVAGGWAVDLHVGRVTRPHSDLEIVVLADDVPAVLAAFDAPEWLWVVPMDGRLHPLSSSAYTGTHQTWLWSHPARAFVLDVFRDLHDGDTWVCRRDPAIRRPWPQTVATSDNGTPYLAVEVVLLFKAKHARPRDVADLRTALPTLDEPARAWLDTALRQVHPGHPWLLSWGGRLS